MIKSSLKLRSALSDLDPKKIEKQIKSLELAEERAAKATKKMLEVQGIRQQKAEIKELIDVTLAGAEMDRETAETLRRDVEEVLVEARAQLADNTTQAKALEEQEKELAKREKALAKQEKEIEGIRRTATRDAEQALKSRKEYELKLADIKNRLSGL